MAAVSFGDRPTNITPPPSVVSPQVVASRGAFLSAKKEAFQLRWTVEAGHSVRAYYNDHARTGSFCVSTRSAELNFLLSGELWVEFGPARQQVRVRAGEGCIISKATPHQAYLGNNTRLLVVDVDFPEPGAFGVWHLKSGELPPALERCLARAWDETRPSLSVPLEKAICSLVERVPSYDHTALECAHTTSRALTIKSHLEHRYASKTDLDSLAARFGMGRFYLLRAFKENFQTTPMAYVRYLRLEHYVWTMLCNPALEHTAAAADAGIGDYSTFSRSVHASFGVAPSRLFASAAP
jgi:AraC-like DNA-binding protein/mannose-6-phosphate isomerase-like protein (cupin superfamily)